MEGQIREPSCIHSNGTQPMSVCIICKDSLVLIQWREYWKKHPERIPESYKRLQ